MITLGDGVEWLEAQETHSLDGIFSDPPWGAKKRIRGDKTYEWASLLGRVLHAGQRVVRPKGHILLWYGTPHLDRIIRIIASTSLHLNMIITIVGGVPYNLCELIFCLSPTQRFFIDKTSIFYKTERTNSDHPCAKSASLTAQIMREWWKPKQIICDPFAGSDTTGWVAHRQHITCYSFEIDPAMFHIAERRYAQCDLFITTPVKKEDTP